MPEQRTTRRATLKRIKIGFFNKGKYPVLHYGEVPVTITGTKKAADEIKKAIMILDKHSPKISINADKSIWPGMELRFEER
jgi:hypothetical protein